MNLDVTKFITLSVDHYLFEVGQTAWAAYIINMFTLSPSDFFPYDIMILYIKTLMLLFNLCRYNTSCTNPDQCSKNRNLNFMVNES